MNTGLVFRHLARKKKAYLCLLLLRELLYRLVDSMVWPPRVEISERDVYMRRVHRVKLAKKGSYFKQPPQYVRVMVPLWALLGGSGVDIVDTSSQRDKYRRTGIRVETNPSRAVFPGKATAYEPLPRMLWKPTDGTSRNPNRYLLAEVGKIHARQARRYALGFLKEDEK